MRFSPASTSREILDRSSSDVQFIVDSTMTTQATSGDLNVAVGWVHGTKTVEVRLECLGLINGITQAAGLKVGVATYICDQSLASNGVYLNPYTSSTAVFGVLRHMFHDTTTGFHTSAWVTAIAHVEAASGTQINLSGRAYQSLNGAATWNCYMGGTFSPIIMTARELL